MAKSLRCVIKGKVQGVFFRAWVHDQAVQLGLTGWVRNLAQDEVEVLAQGDEQTLTQFMHILRQGSPLSRIGGADCGWLDHDKTYDAFQIRG